MAERDEVDERKIEQMFMLNNDIHSLTFYGLYFDFEDYYEVVEQIVAEYQVYGEVVSYEKM